MENNLEGSIVDGERVREKLDFSRVLLLQLNRLGSVATMIKTADMQTEPDAAYINGILHYERLLQPYQDTEYLEGTPALEEKPATKGIKGIAEEIQSSITRIKGYWSEESGKKEWIEGEVKKKDYALEENYYKVVEARLRIERRNIESKRLGLLMDLACRKGFLANKNIRDQW